MIGLGWVVSKGAEYATGLFTNDAEKKTSIRMLVAGCMMPIDPIGGLLGAYASVQRLEGKPFIDNVISLIGTGQTVAETMDTGKQ